MYKNNKKNNNNPVMLVKLRPFPFRFNAILHREEEAEERVLRYLVATQSQRGALRQCEDPKTLPEKSQPDRNPLPVFFFIIISSSLFLCFNKSAPSLSSPFFFSFSVFFFLILGESSSSAQRQKHTDAGCAQGSSRGTPGGVVYTSV